MSLTLVFSAKGGYMHCYNTKEVERAKAKGFEVVEPKKKRGRPKGGKNK